MNNIDRMTDSSSCRSIWDISEIDMLGNTALHRAVRKGSIEEIAKCINMGVPLNTRNRKDYTALDLAAKNGNKEIVQKLLESGAKFIEVGHRTVIGAWSTLALAVKGGNIEVIQMLLDKGANINDPPELNPYGITTLPKIALIDGKLEIFKMLLKRANDKTILTKDGSGCTLIHHLARTPSRHISMGLEPRKELITMLLDMGLDINAQNCFGETALHSACVCIPIYKPNIEMIKFLLQNHADPSIKDMRDQSYDLILKENISEDEYANFQDWKRDHLYIHG